MNRKIIAVTLGVITVGLIFLTYLNSMIDGMQGTYINYSISYYLWRFVVNLALNEVVAFTIGILLIFRYSFNQSIKMKVAYIIVILAILGLLVGGLFIGISYQYDSAYIPIFDQLSTYINIIYGGFIVSIIIYLIFGWMEHLFQNSYYNIIMILIVVNAIGVYFQTVSTYGSMVVSIVHPDHIYLVRNIINYIVLYPTTVAIYILFTLQYVKERKQTKYIIE